LFPAEFSRNPLRCGVLQVPLLIGMQVNLAVFLHWHTLLLALALLVVAVAGKMAAGLVAGPSVDRVAIAIGMLPRGEIALIFIGVGKSLGVIDEALFAALVLVVILLACGSSLALKWAFVRTPSRWS
jgi:Kef-type K+ transport system membrane component KefB